MAEPIKSTSPPPITSFIKKWWVNSREAIGHYYRNYFHTITVTLLTIFNLIVGYSAMIIYFSQWVHETPSPEVFLSIFMQQPPERLLGVMDLLYIPFDTFSLLWLFVIFNLPLLTWFYSTITRPITKGYRHLINYTSSKRGRVFIATLNGIPFIWIYCAIAAWYVNNYMFDFFASIRSDREFLVVQSMESFGYVLLTSPIFFTIVAGYFTWKQFIIYEDIRKNFFKWEFPLFAKQNFSLKNDRCDVIVGWEYKTNKPIVLNEQARYLHELVCGATGTGKTSTTILTRISQDLIRIARGVKMGIVLLEPKGDACEDVIKVAKELGVPDEKIFIVDPTNLAKSVKFNPFAGPMEAAAESFRGVLDSLTGDQDEFFKGQQNETAAFFTLLGKLRFPDTFNITHMQRMYTDPRYLASMTEEVRSHIDRKKTDPRLTDQQKAELQHAERIVSYFEDEVIEYKTYRSREGENLPQMYPSGHRYAGLQMVENKKDKFVTGAKKYVNEITMNTMLNQMMVSSDGEEVLDLDLFLQEGGVLLINSALGELEELSILLGQFFIRQFQSAVFRRPHDGTMVKRIDKDGNEVEKEYKRIPVFFTIDEFPLFANEAFERMLTLGRSYKVGSLIAIQSLGQLEKLERGYDKTIMSNASNKTVFGRGNQEDNERFSLQFGEEFEIEESLNETTTPVSVPNAQWNYRYNTQRKLEARFSPTDIKELEFKHFIIECVDEEGNIQRPVEGVGKFINETKFLKKFMNIGKIELETKNYKAFSVGNYVDHYQSLISTVFKGDKDTNEGENLEQDSDNLELPTGTIEIIDGDDKEHAEIIKGNEENKQDEVPPKTSDDSTKSQDQKSLSSKSETPNEPNEEIKEQVEPKKKVDDNLEKEHYSEGPKENTKKSDADKSSKESIVEEKKKKATLSSKSIENMGHLFYGSKRKDNKAKESKDGLQLEEQETQTEQQEEQQVQSTHSEMNEQQAESVDEIIKQLNEGNDNSLTSKIPKENKEDDLEKNKKEPPKKKEEYQKSYAASGLTVLPKDEDDDI
ncbi:hypothetical protein J2S74_002890 [Evansella vedderi]|uniref:TraD/TraG TraM recognition site domain-containing protein n=1 Tax=Evansella vedderi TaxID=38282 RepID=A0ABT9ZWA6_9BACI|nr:type IV secretory system conjugative DNA transfer family protein [Evansella vedderi]MDQ0255508.1 hypothetical protein [Evansella vedderi]